MNLYVIPGFSKYVFEWTSYKVYSLDCYGIKKIKPLSEVKMPGPGSKAYGYSLKKDSNGKFQRVSMQSILRKINDAIDTGFYEE